jgi:hypothetical protein
MGVQINYTGNAGEYVEMQKRGKKEEILLPRPVAHRTLIFSLSRRPYVSIPQGLSCICKDMVQFL